MGEPPLPSLRGLLTVLPTRDPEEPEYRTSRQRAYQRPPGV